MEKVISFKNKSQAETFADCIDYGNKYKYVEVEFYDGLWYVMYLENNP